MEIITYGKDGSIKLPVGYRFHPSDDVLVGYYLRKKLFEQPLPNLLIPEFDVFRDEPKGLPGGGKGFSEQKFFFYDTKSRVFENPDKRAVGNGTGQWRIMEKGKDIVIPRSTLLIGKRNTLVFWEAKGTGFVKTNWVMHEFQLALQANPSQKSIWAVYRIFEKKEAKKGKRGRRTRGEASNSRDVESEVEAQSVIDFTMETGGFSGPPSPVSP